MVWNTARVMAGVVAFSLMTACTGSQVPIERLSSESTIVKTTAVPSNGQDTALTTSTLPAEPGYWLTYEVERPFGIGGFAVVDDKLAMLMPDILTGGLRIAIQSDDGAWEVVHNDASFDSGGYQGVQWRHLNQLRDSLVVTGQAILAERRGELHSVLLHAVVTGDGIEYIGGLSSETGGYVKGVGEFGDRLIAVGRLSTEEEQFGLGLWWSDDGSSWSRYDVADGIAAGVVEAHGLAVAGDVAVVATSSRSGHPISILRSIDGFTWKRVDLPESSDIEHPSVAGVVHDGEQFMVLATGFSREMQYHTHALWTSPDGATWEEVDPQIDVLGSGQLVGLEMGSRPGIASADAHGEYRGASIYCYDDLTACRVSFDGVWTLDAGQWTRVRLPVEAPVPGGAYSFRTARHDGRSVFGGTHGQGYVVYTWMPGPSEQPVPEFDPVSHDLSIDSLGLATLDRRIPFEPGVKYAAPVRSECFLVGELEIYDGSAWVAEPSTLPSPTRDWPIKEESFGGTVIYGTVRLQSDGLVEYSVPGVGVVGTYHRVDISMRQC